LYKNLIIKYKESIVKLRDIWKGSKY
jgi:hypothetical protein